MRRGNLVAMRKAAALAFAIPGMEIDIANGRELVARIERRFDGAHVPLGTTLLSPCAFRAAVGRATAHTRGGGRALFLGLAPDIDLQLHYVMPFTGASTPLGVIVSRVGERVVHVFATELDPVAVRCIVAATPLHPSLPTSGPGQVRVDVSWDDVTRVSLVHCETRIAALSTIRPYVEALMHSILVQAGVAEIVATVEAATAPSTG
ncbi:MAG: hypothetical protein JWM34_2696 [Ilumatobacteraceae bacterium]|nr:hypothetical protein [Ilumatobacteraceae bacterium]